MLSIKHRGHRLAALAVGTCLALVAGGVTVPAAAAASAAPTSAAQSHDRDDRTDPVLLFAADGMRQDLIEKYTKERRGALPGFADLLRHGASASGGGMLTQAPPNTGAGWYTMATGAWPGVTGSTNNTFAINTQPLANRHRRVRSRRAAGRDHRPIRGTRRQEGHPAGMGRRPERRHQRSHRRFPVVLLRSRRDHQFRLAVRPGESDHLVRAAIRPGGFGRPQRAGPERPPPSARPRKLTWRCSISGTRQVRAGCLHLRQHRRSATELRPGVVRAQQECRRTGGRSARRPVGRRQGQDRRWGPRRIDGRHAGQGRGAERRRLAGPAVPHLGEPGQRDLAGLPGSGRHHRLRRIHRAEVPHLDRRRFRGARGRRGQRGDLRPAGAVLGEGAPAAAPLPDQDLPAGSRAGRVPGNRRDPASVPRSGLPDPGGRGRQPRLRRRPAGRHPRRAGPAAGGVHPARVSGRRHHHAARATPAGQGTSPPSSVPTTGSRRNSWPSTPARCWSTSACCPSRRPPTAARPPARPSARPRPAGPVAPCRST